MEQMRLITETDYQRMISEIKSHLSEEMKSITTVKAPEKHVNAKQLAAHLNITVETLWRRFKDKKYPASLIDYDAGRKVYYISKFEAHIKKQ